MVALGYPRVAIEEVYSLSRHLFAVLANVEGFNQR